MRSRHWQTNLTRQQLEALDDDVSIDILRVFKHRDDASWVFDQIRGVAPSKTQTMNVPVEDLTATQSTLSTDIIRKPRSTKLPEAILWDGSFYVVEGHHRIAHEIVVKGASQIAVRVDVYE